MTELRPYQGAAIQSAWDYWRQGGHHGLIDMATGLGKSVVVADINRRFAKHGRRVLNVVHNRELVSQNFKAFLRLDPGADAGVYSAGLNRKQAHNQITFASIQSIYKKAEVMGQRSLLLVDEAHLIPPSGDGMYRTLIDGLLSINPNMRVLGLTATPYRLGSGRLDEGDGSIFDDIIYTYGIGDGIKDGWLTPLISKASLNEIDVTGVKRSGGEFVNSALAAAAEDEEMIHRAVQEMLELAGGRKSWLVFCVGVKHSHQVADIMKQYGITAEAVTGETPSGQRDMLTNRFKSGQLRALCNANLLTTGFDAPNVDMIAFLRPTLSTGLYVQMCGRGTRLFEGKENCLVLDYAGNVRRHGPVDAIQPPRSIAETEKDEQPDRVKVDDVRAKACPSCDVLSPIQARECFSCGAAFPIEEVKHEGEADTVAIMSTEDVPPETVAVVDWECQVWTPREEGKPHTLCVTYYAGIGRYREWVCFNHSGRARAKAEQWWHWHSNSNWTPANVDHAELYFDQLVMPSHINVVRDGRYWKIVGRQFSQLEVA